MAEKGTHEELLALRGIYHNLWSMQLKNREGEVPALLTEEQLLLGMDEQASGKGSEKGSQKVSGSASGSGKGLAALLSSSASSSSAAAATTVAPSSSSPSLSNERKL